MEAAARANTVIRGGSEQDHKNDFLNCFEHWKKKGWCVTSGVDYFEGDKIDIHE